MLFFVQKLLTMSYRCCFELPILDIHAPKVNKTVQLMSPVVTENIKCRIDFLMYPIK